MDKFQEMRVFVAVVDAGSFVRAADALDLSKAAVSRLVSDLEARLGVRLLHRTTRKLSLTEVGEVFHERCRQLLDSVAEAEAELSTHSGAVIGRLKVNVPFTFGLLHLASLWPRFMAQHPQVVLDVTLSDRFVDLVEEGFDVAIRIAALPSSTLVCRQLARTRIVLCAAPGYLAAHGTPRVPADLASHTVIAYSYRSGGDEWQFDGPDGRVSVRTRPSVHTNSGDTCRTAALQHQGIILQPDFLVGPDLKRGALVELMPDYRSIELGVYAVYATRKHMPMKSRRLIDFLVEAFIAPSW